MASLLGCQCRILSARLNKISLLKNVNQMPNTVKFSHWKKAVNIMKQEMVLNSRSDTYKGLGSLLILRNTIHSKAGHIILKPTNELKSRLIFKRLITSGSDGKTANKTDVVLYTLSILVISVGLAYAGVPLFKVFCRQFGFGGNAEISRGHDTSKIGNMNVIEDREITVHFSADTHAGMRWKFRPQQLSIKVKPGETALAFYTATNPTDKPIIGIATYTVTPYIAAPYFNKIQCFCFEEQILNPHEQVDMPVFFYIDPDYDEDPFLEYEDEIRLSYTFFEAKAGWDLPLPGFMQTDKPKADEQPA